MKDIVENFVHLVLMIIVYYSTLHGYLDGLFVVRFIMVYFGISLVASSMSYYLRKD